MASQSLAGATQDEVRRHNLGSLLRLLHRQGAASRSELTARTGLNRSTVGALTVDLAAAGLVREDEPVGRGVGRPSILVVPVEGSAHVVALDIGVEHAQATLVGVGGAVLRRGALRHVPGEEAERLASRLARLTQRLTADGGVTSPLVGVGVGVPGVVRHDDGVVEVAPNRGWVDVPLGALLSERLGSHVHVANDADLSAIAEQARGAAAGLANLVMVSGDVGVGGGIVLDGQLSTGAHGYGGEVGHMVVDPHGKVCRCGSVGCWETTIGAEAVAAALGLGADDDVHAALAGIAPGDPRLESVGRWLGIGVQNLVNIFNPDAIILGGLIGEVYARAQETVVAVSSRSLAAPRRGVELRVASLGADAITVGAAEVAFSDLLSDPLGHLSRVRAARVA